MTRTLRLAKAAVLATALLAVAGVASAHTISIGYENAGPGSVSFWYGSYHAYGSPLNEGSLNLVGINGNPFASTTVLFNLNTGVKPLGLIDGVTNFYASGPSGGSGPLTSTNTLSGLPVTSWQGATFSGLAPGDYQFTYLPIGSPTVHWAPWNEAVRSNDVTLEGAVVGVPEPASLGLLGLGLVGLTRKFRR